MPHREKLIFLQSSTKYNDELDITRELIESRRGSETIILLQETSLTDLFFTLVRLVSETDFLPLQRLVSQRSKTGQQD